MTDNPACPQCDGTNTRLVPYDSSDPATGYRDAGEVRECGECGERF